MILYPGIMRLILKLGPGLFFKSMEHLIESAMRVQILVKTVVSVLIIYKTSAEAMYPVFPLTRDKLLAKK